MLGYDNYATRFESIMSPMGNIQGGYGMAGGYGSGYGAGYGMGYPGVIVDPLMDQRTVDGVVAADATRSNYYTRPIPKHPKHDDIPTMLGIGATALGATALAIAAMKSRSAGKALKNAQNEAEAAKKAAEAASTTAASAGSATGAAVNPITGGVLLTEGVPLANAGAYRNPLHRHALAGLDRGAAAQAQRTGKPVTQREIIEALDPQIRAGIAEDLSRNQVNPVVRQFTEYGRTGRTSQRFVQPVAPQPLSQRDIIEALEPQVTAGIASDLSRNQVNPVVRQFTEYGRTGRTSQRFVQPVAPQPLSQRDIIEALEPQVTAGIAGNLSRNQVNPVVRQFTEFSRNGNVSGRLVKPVAPRTAQEVIAEEAAQSLGRNQANPLINAYTQHSTQRFVQPVAPRSAQEIIAEEAAQSLGRNQTNPLINAYTQHSTQRFVQPVAPQPLSQRDIIEALEPQVTAGIASDLSRNQINPVVQQFTQYDRTGGAIKGLPQPSKAVLRQMHERMGQA